MAEGATVYVVDDDESVRRALARLIRSAGYGVETFGSARAFLDGQVPDRLACLVLDVRMPGVGGLDLQAELASARPDLPIVFLTGHANVPLTVRAMKAGAVDLLQKPIKDKHLLDAIGRALGRGREARARAAERAAVQARLDSLTTREREVLDLVVSGMLNKQIAAVLGIAEKTVKVHRGRMTVKMQAQSVADLARTIERLGPAPNGGQAAASPGGVPLAGPLRARGKK